MNKLIIISIFPAPYRSFVIECIKKKFNTEVFFERSIDGNRNPNWFESENWFYFLDTKKGKVKYYDSFRKLNRNDLFLFYDYTTIHSLLLILKCIVIKTEYILNCDGAILKPNFFRDIVKRFLIRHASAYFSSGKIAEDYFVYYGANRDKIYKHPFTTLNRDDMLNNIILKEEKLLIKKRLGINQKKVVLAVGRFISLKRYDLLIKAWKEVKPNYMLIIIGGGEERGNYERLIKENFLNNIVLVDFKKKEELQDYYKTADLFVHPTSTDVWGLVINEAMACGLPIITTNKCVAGLELIKDNENGFIIPVGNTDILAKKIGIILDDDNLREKMAKNNLEAIKSYTIENMAKSQISTLEKIIKNRKHTNNGVKN